MDTITAISTSAPAPENRWFRAPFRKGSWATLVLRTANLPPFIKLFIGVDRGEYSFLFKDPAEARAAGRAITDAADFADGCRAMLEADFELETA